MSTIRILNPTIMGITTRGLLGRKRALLLIPLPLLLIGLAVLGRLSGSDAGVWGEGVLIGLGMSVVLPLTALIVGTSALGSEIDDGTIVHILTKPLPRREIILAKLAVAFGITVPVAAIPLGIAGVIAGSTRLGLGLAAGAVVGGLAYAAIFVALSLVTRRPVAFGLIYLLVWESLLAGVLSGTKQFSVQQYSLTIADRIAANDLVQSTVSLPVAIVMSAVLTVGGTFLAIDRLRSFSLKGESA
jgi:ABC-2 type transport system permease protein